MSFPAHRISLAIMFGLFPLFAAVHSASGESADPALARNAMRLLSANCLACHNSEKHKGGLQMTSRETLVKGSDSGPILDKDSPEQSVLLKVLAPDADPHMPPKRQLSTNQIALFGNW